MDLPLLITDSSKSDFISLPVLPLIDLESTVAFSMVCTRVDRSWVAPLLLRSLSECGDCDRPALMAALRWMLLCSFIFSRFFFRQKSKLQSTLATSRLLRVSSFWLVVVLAMSPGSWFRTRLNAARNCVFMPT